MRLDLSKEQINSVIDCLNSSVGGLEMEIENSEIKGSMKDVIEETIAVRKATMLYLKDYMSDKIT